MSVSVRRKRVLLAMAALGALSLSACGDDGGSAVDSVNDTLAQAAVRAQAEAMRAVVKTRAGDDAASYRKVSLLSEAAKDLLGDTTVSGITDGDGDGLDDDGRVQLVMNGQRACFSVSGSNTTVSDGSC
jgi:hypothetical protein